MSQLLAPLPNIVANQTIRAVIVEDEEQGLQNLKNHLANYCQEIEVVATAESVVSALALLKDPTTQPHVAFLDINLADGLVFQVLNQLEEINFDIIFVTAYSHFAIKACKYSCIGFVEKPIDPEELKDSVARIRHSKQMAAAKQNQQRIEVFQQHVKGVNPLGKISLSAIDGIYFIYIKDIIRLEADDNYTTIFTNNKEKIVIAKTLKYYEDLLEGLNFYRVHKKHLINVNFMAKIVRADGMLVMEDSTNIEISRRRRPAFYEFLKNLNNNIGE